jgi:hypothetical protein
VWTFPKNGGEGRRKAPDNIFHETDFYTIRRSDGQRDLSLENGLATLESQFCRIRDAHISRREPLSPEDKGWVCAFVAAMHFRTRTQRDALRSQWSHAVRVAEDMQQALNAMSPTKLLRHRPLRPFPGESEPSLTIEDARTLSNDPLQHMLMKVIEDDLPVLLRMTLTFFTTDDPTAGFITSDHPCLWFDTDKRRGQMMSLQSPTVEVTMPVAPNTLLVQCWEEFPDYWPVATPQVEEFNRFHQGGCDEYLIVNRNETKAVWFT